MKIKNRIGEEDEHSYRIQNTWPELKFFIAWTGSLDWLVVYPSIVITSGRTTKFGQEKGRTKLKRWRKMKNNWVKKREKSLILNLAQEVSKFCFVQNDSN